MTLGRLVASLAAITLVTGSAAAEAPARKPSAGAWAQSTPRAWTPMAGSPLREIWSFDTKG